jgi:prepilin-type N-terminal cleavage/methylation domain-containing protein
MKIQNANERGMTLIEIIVVIGIFGIISIAISSFQRNIFVFNKFSADSLTNIQDAQTIVRTMVKELRAASSGNNGAFAISQAATNTITFFSDTDSDGLKEQIRYFIASSTLIKGSIKPSGLPLTYNPVNENTYTLAYNVKNSTSTPLFEYFDSNYMGTSTPLAYPLTVTNIHLVKIILLLDSDPNRSPPVRMYTSQVNIRNLKDNL